MAIALLSANQLLSIAKYAFELHGDTDAAAKLKELRELPDAVLDDCDMGTMCGCCHMRLGITAYRDEDDELLCECCGVNVMEYGERMEVVRLWSDK